MVHPKISVVMTAFNRKDYIREAIESILNQTYQDFEFIIVDDCSIDATKKIIEEYAQKDNRIKFLQNETNMGLIYSLNRGFSIAKGEYIARMDDDDISLPERFKKQVEFMDKNQDITVLGTFIEILSKYVNVSWVTETDPDKLAVLMNFYNPLCHPSVMIRKSFLDAHNLKYSLEGLHAEEYLFWCEIIKNGGKLANLPEILLKYRVHNNRISQNSRTSKIQQQTACRIKMSQLKRFLKSEKYCKKVIKKSKSFSLKTVKPKDLYDILCKMQNNNSNIVSSEAIEGIKKEYCGIPSVMEIFFASDDKFSKHLCVAMASILDNSLPFENFNFYILDGGISDKNKIKINKIKKIKKCNIEYIKIDDSMFEQCPITPDCQHITKQTYYRYIIPIIKPELKKAFYFDCDIVVERSLNAFWNVNLYENYVAAVEDLWDFAHEYYKKSLNLNKSFNAGVILLNIEKMKQDNITQKLFDNTVFLSSNKLIKWVDQDILNYTFKNKVLFVSPDYNLQQTAFFATQHSLYTKEEMEFAKKYPTLIHYSGNIKPWQNYCKHPLWKRYFVSLNKTPYKTLKSLTYNVPNYINKVGMLCKCWNI